MFSCIRSDKGVLVMVIFVWKIVVKMYTQRIHFIFLVVQNWLYLVPDWLPALGTCNFVRPRGSETCVYSY